jgi:hypothetical protein
MFLLNHTDASFEDEPSQLLGVHESAPILELLGKKYQKLTIQQKAISIKHSLFDMNSSQLIKGLTQQITKADARSFLQLT